MPSIATWHPGSARHRASGRPTARNGWAGLPEAFRTRHPSTFRWDADRAVSRRRLTFFATLRWRALSWLGRVVHWAARKGVGHVSSTHLEAKDVHGRSKPVAWTPATTDAALVASQPVAIEARRGFWPARIRCPNLIHELDRSLFIAMTTPVRRTASPRVPNGVDREDPAAGRGRRFTSVGGGVRARLCRCRFGVAGARYDRCAVIGSALRLSGRRRAGLMCAALCRDGAGETRRGRADARVSGVFIDAWQA